MAKAFIIPKGGALLKDTVLTATKIDGPAGEFKEQQEKQKAAAIDRLNNLGDREKFVLAVLKQDSTEFIYAGLNGSEQRSVIDHMINNYETMRNISTDKGEDIH